MQKWQLDSNVKNETPMSNIIWGVIIFGWGVVFFYLMSRLQMRAWLKEVDKFLESKFDNLQKQNKDERQEKK